MNRYEYILLEWDVLYPTPFFDSNIEIVVDFIGKLGLEHRKWCGNLGLILKTVQISVS